MHTFILITFWLFLGVYLGYKYSESEVNKLKRIISSKNTLRKYGNNPKQNVFETEKKRLHELDNYNSRELLKYLGYKGDTV